MSNKPVSSKIVFQCPVSGRKAAPIPYADGGEGVFVPFMDGTPPELPMGWGRIVIDVVVPNPEIAKVKADREEAIKQANAVMEREIEELSPSDRKAFDAAQKDGQVERETRLAVEKQFPLPEEDRIYLRMQYPVLSDEALKAAITALVAAGFNIESNPFKDLP